jgi:hypothetical protein
MMSFTNHLKLVSFTNHYLDCSSYLLFSPVSLCCSVMYRMLYIGCAFSVCKEKYAACHSRLQPYYFIFWILFLCLILPFQWVKRQIFVYCFFLLARNVY